LRWKRQDRLVVKGGDRDHGNRQNQEAKHNENHKFPDQAEKALVERARHLNAA